MEMSSSLYTAVKAALLLYNSQDMSKHLAKLNDALRKAGMSQSELARRIGVTRGAVNHWVTGRAEISMEHLLKIAKVLGMSTSEILGDDVLFAETKEQRELLQLADRLSDHDLEQLIRMARLLAQDQES